MRKHLLPFCVAVISLTSANAETLIASQPSQSSPTGNSDSAICVQSLPSVKNGAPADASGNWSEWTDNTTGSIDSNIEFQFKTLLHSQGEQWVDFPEHFTIKTRTNNDDTDLVQYKLCDIFNHVDIILDYDRGTMLVSADRQDTGITIATPTEGGYQTYHFLMQPTKMFYLSNTMTDPSFFLLIEPNRGYNTTSLFDFDNSNLSSYYISTDSPCFIPSNRESATIHLLLPSFPAYNEEITSYRYVCLDGLRAAVDPDLWTLSNTLCEPEPEAGSFLTGSSADLTITPDEPFTSICIVPLDSKGRPAYYSANLSVTWNKPLEGEWTAIGDATLSENIWMFGINRYDMEYPFLDFSADPYNPAFTGESPVTRQIAVERSTANPDMYRIKNPFGPAHPYHQYLTLTDPEDDFYVVIDASDPSYVKFQPTCTGFSLSPQNPYMLRNTPGVYFMTPEEVANPDYYGTLSGRKIKFGINSIGSGYFWVPAFLEKLNQCAFELELPEESAISLPGTDAPEDSDAVYYNLQGQRVDAPRPGATYIRLRGSKADKVTVS